MVQYITHTQTTNTHITKHFNPLYYLTEETQTNKQTYRQTFKGRVLFEVFERILGFFLNMTYKTKYTKHIMLMNIKKTIYG